MRPRAPLPLLRENAGATFRRSQSQPGLQKFSIDSKRIVPISFTVSANSSATTMGRRGLPDAAVWGTLGRAAVPAIAC